MIADRKRTDAYAEALRARVTAGSVVLDIGAGSGIMTLLACRAGARKVYAVEPESVIQFAREAVEANGYGDRVEFIQALSTAVAIPEKVDVIVSDVHGVLPFYWGSLGSILDARDRFLKPGGFLIPERETIWGALVSAPDFYRGIVGPWENGSKFRWGDARWRAVNAWQKCALSPASILGQPKTWTVLDYPTLQSAQARGPIGWTLSQTGDAHGFCLWFDCETSPGHAFSNSPLSGERHVFGQCFFPFPEACRLTPGDQVAIDVRADVVGDDYVWSWNTEIRDAGGRAIKAAFEQSQFHSAPISMDWLRKSNAAFVPSPNQEAAVDKMIMDLLFAGITLEEISRRVADGFPDRFPEWRKALTRVGEMALRYSQ